jgi:hypothetical protein
MIFVDAKEIAINIYSIYDRFGMYVLLVSHKMN